MFEQQQTQLPLHGPDLPPQGTKVFSASSLRTFPVALTMVLSLLFILPVYMILGMVYDPTVSYFSSCFAWILLLVPVIIIGVHVIHVRKGRPSKLAIICSFLIPGMLIIVVSGWVYISALESAEKLFSTDCNASHEKQNLQKSWEAAFDIFQSCLQSTAAQNPYSVSQLMRNFRIQDCDEYKPSASSHRRAWEYLQYLEQTAGCAGWCYHGQQLWSSGSNKDSCSASVAAVYKLYIYPHAMKLCYMMVFTLVMVAMFGTFVLPMLRA